MHQQYSFLGYLIRMQHRNTRREFKYALICAANNHSIYTNYNGVMKFCFSPLYPNCLRNWHCTQKCLMFVITRTICN